MLSIIWSDSAAFRPICSLHLVLLAVFLVLIVLSQALRDHPCVNAWYLILSQAHRSSPALALAPPPRGPLFPSSGALALLDCTLVTAGLGLRSDLIEGRFDAFVPGSCQSMAQAPPSPAALLSLGSERLSFSRCRSVPSFA